MINTAKLRGLIVERGYSQKEVAETIGISTKTFYLKMKKGVFDSDEIMAMVEALEIKNPAEIFFCSQSNAASHEREGKQ